eukprot:TRINITY_DN57666_c0_g1_i1.p1 TRINITY_DN57666_c0_g1~~TRINITY_DN57666_c0_g1_i1.p1  ORF type:complete len:543 (-),score=15.24 TRINITY_DN57666_c0_g1_i1:10-1638(-)
MGFLVVAVHSLWGIGAALWGIAGVYMILIAVSWKKVRLVNELLRRVSSVLVANSAIVFYSFLLIVILCGWIILCFTCSASWYRDMRWIYVLPAILWWWMGSLFPTIMFLTCCRDLGGGYFKQITARDCCGLASKSCKFVWRYHLGSCWLLSTPLMWFIMHYQTCAFTPVFVALNNIAVVPSWGRAKATLTPVRKVVKLLAFEAWFEFLCLFGGITTGVTTSLIVDDEDWAWYIAIFATLSGYMISSTHWYPWVATLRVMWVCFFEEPETMLEYNWAFHNLFLAMVAHQVLDVEKRLEFLKKAPPKDEGIPPAPSMDGSGVFPVHALTTGPTTPSSGGRLTAMAEGINASQDQIASGLSGIPVAGSGSTVTFNPPPKAFMHLLEVGDPRSREDVDLHEELQPYFDFNIDVAGYRATQKDRVKQNQAMQKSIQETLSRSKHHLDTIEEFIVTRDVSSLQPAGGSTSVVYEQVSTTQVPTVQVTRPQHVPGAQDPVTPVSSPAYATGVLQPVVGGLMPPAPATSPEPTPDTSLACPPTPDPTLLT